MEQTIMHIVLYIWVLVSAGFTLVAKLNFNKIVAIILKIMAIANVVWVILDILKIQY